MKIIRKIKRGKAKGWNIRQTKDGKFHAYIGIVNQTQTGFNTIGDCEIFIEENT